jgi:hypothetical protein
LIDRKGRPVFPQSPAIGTIIPQTMIPLGKDPRAIAVKAFISQR